MFETIIGLEIHIQLKNRTKMFCGCSADIWEAQPNSHVCPTCLGLPGALPTINKSAVEQTLKMALALGCEINHESYFERKNYFYPDLPKGYQISQHRRPLGVSGCLTIGGTKIGISDVHLEEDVGKSFHETDSRTHEEYSLIDFNKSGIPLMEVVSAPEMHSAKEVVEYCKRIQQLVRFLGISDGDIEKGQMRFEVNISISSFPEKKKQEKGNRPLQATSYNLQAPLPNYRVEIKNLSSFRFVQKAIEYEIERQTALLEKGEELKQETRGFDEKREVTFSQREKEAAHDYRYFPEPDLPPLSFNNPPLAEEIRRLRDTLPELPWEAEERLIKAGVRQDYAVIIAGDARNLTKYSELVATGLSPSAASGVLVNRPEWVNSVSAEEVKRELAKKAESLIDNESELQTIAQRVINANPQPTSDFRNGKENALQFLVGQMMKESRGKADPQLAAEALRKMLKSERIKNKE